MRVLDYSSLLIFLVVSALHQGVTARRKPMREWERDQLNLRIRTAQDYRPPTIHGPDHIVAGRNLALDCRISVLAVDRISLRWRFPSSVPIDRMQELRNSTRPLHTNFATSIEQNTLTIKNVQLSDAGEYICDLTDVENVLQSSSKIITVSYINVTMDSNNRITLPERKTFRWNVKVVALPEEFQLKWFTPNGTLIEAGTTEEKGKYSHTRKGSHHEFSVSNLSLEDSGNYSIEVRTSTDEKLKILTRQLTVIPNIDYKIEEESSLIQKQILRAAEGLEQAAITHKKAATSLKMLVKKYIKHNKSRKSLFHGNSSF